MDETAALFDLPDDAIQPASPTAAGDPHLSYGRRLTLLQAATLARGWHPLGSPLHPHAAPHDDRTAPGLRCRTCTHLTHQGGCAGSYLKCDAHTITRGPATDARGWWPACSRHTPDEKATP